ncbi:pentapeptide repeat-containing protein [Paenibacillus endoradicis]|uniref:pentapeptide repeat-containing protein n=1 Tax=Paenibacillus endoradicis TaxID=2972487 RepID=UPI0021591FAC|nr:pentapeptide repeat-containing protein [Paenibacillus endoradicis]MCR8657366.1 pentapeptide repeat-containing protein [Paenibacillus endoradicis]
MTQQLLINSNNQNQYLADCQQCFGLCCVALPYAKSADFAFDKDSGSPCKNLQADYRCGIHQKLRSSGLRGCTVYECFGAGQKVSQMTYNGKSWRDNPELAKEMFDLLPIMQQLHEMLYYLTESLSLQDAKPIYAEVQKAIVETERLTNLNTLTLLELHVPTHRAFVNDLLLQTSELVRAKVKIGTHNSKHSKNIRGRDCIGAKLKGANLKGSNLRGVLFIAADLRQADMRKADLIGADLRDADLSGANLIGSIFLTQAQVNSANGNSETQLPSALTIPDHWLD